jgi:hypothetical protein
VDSADHEREAAMSKKAKAIAAAVIAFFYVGHGFWLLLVFPSDPDYWLAFMIIIPFHICVAAGIGVVAFFCLELARNRRRGAIIMACFFVGTILAELLLFPASPDEAGPFGQMSQYDSVFRRYPDDIEHDDLYSGNRAERAAMRC